jgi:hypothetical protein
MSAFVIMLKLCKYAGFCCQFTNLLVFRMTLYRFAAIKYEFILQLCHENIGAHLLYTCMYT